MFIESFASPPVLLEVIFMLSSLHFTLDFFLFYSISYYFFSVAHSFLLLFLFLLLLFIYGVSFLFTFESEMMTFYYHFNKESKFSCLNHERSHCYLYHELSHRFFIHLESSPKIFNGEKWAIALMWMHEWYAQMLLPCLSNGTVESKFFIDWSK